jgi:hypothetical protein
MTAIPRVEGAAIMTGSYWANDDIGADPSALYGRVDGGSRPRMPLPGLDLLICPAPGRTGGTQENRWCGRLVECPLFPRVDLALVRTLASTSRQIGFLTGDYLLPDRSANLTPIFA